MAVNPFRQEPDGDYIVFRGSQSEEQKQDAEKVLLSQGCKRVRFESLEDGRMRCHGYLRQQ